MGLEALERDNCRTETRRYGPQPPLPGTPLCCRRRPRALPHGLPRTEGSRPRRGAQPGQEGAAASPQDGDAARRAAARPRGSSPGPRCRSGLWGGRAPPARAASRLSRGHGGTPDPRPGPRSPLPAGPHRPPRPGRGRRRLVLTALSKPRCSVRQSSRRAGVQRYHGCLRRGAPEGERAALLRLPGAGG